MKRNLILALLGLSLIAVSCSKDDGPGSNTGPDQENSFDVDVKGDIKTNTTWSADSIYHLKGFVYVTNGATLTIEPGTIIKGDKASKGTLIITRGAKINAVGTADKPIVFTSAMAAGARREGDWGGIILLGKAPVNLGANVKIEGGLTPTADGDEATYIEYGGTDANDNSGKLKYVRIEFAGIPFSPDNEINGLTFGGVGAGTEIEYVEVYRSGDDSYEWFGGTVNAKHLLAIGTWDDDFDTDNGFSGKIQFALAQRYTNIADISGSNGFESDNNADGDNKTPQTSAVFSNVTIIGPMVNASSKPNANFQHAAQIRRNSSISIFNSIFAGYTEGIYIDDTKPKGTSELTSPNYTGGTLKIKSNLIYGCDSKGNQLKSQVLSSIETQLITDNTLDPDSYADALLNSPNKYPADIVAGASAGTPDFTLKSGSAAASGADKDDDKLGDSFFEKVDYRGAFGTTDWSAGWASFDPQLLPYTTPGEVN